MRKLKRIGLGIGGAALLGALIALYIGSRDSVNLSRHLTPGERREAKQAAASGQSGLRKKEWDEYGFMSKYQNFIKGEAGKLDLPGRLVAARFYNENIGRHYIDDLKDRLGLDKGWDVTMGPGQIRRSNAMNLDGVIENLHSESIADINDLDYETYRQKLENPEEHISTVARELARLRDERMRQLGRKSLTAKQLIRDRKSMALISTRYTTGQDDRKPNFRGNDTMTAYNLPWMQQLFPEDTIYSCLDTVINEEDALRIKEKLGEGIQAYPQSRAIASLNEAFNRAYLVAESREWGKGKEYYRSIEVVALMYSARAQCDRGNFSKAYELYNGALQRKLQLNDAYDNGVDIPKIVGGVPGGVKVADESFIRKRLKIVESELKR